MQAAYNQYESNSYFLTQIELVETILMIKQIAVLSAFAFCTGAIAHADTINGYFSANGNDSFTNSTITFGSAKVDGAIGGTFASYLTDGTAVNFLQGALPYHLGTNTPPNPPYTGGFVPIFSTSGNGETFTFNMTSYDAENVTNSIGCTAGSTCLDITGMGYFTGTGAFEASSTPATFSFTSQYVPGQPTATLTTFSASASVTPSAVPEPSSLALLGTGLVGAVSVLRRKLQA